MGCVLGQHDETGCKERAIYYLSKKFTDYKSKYSSLEKMCCALTWTTQRLRQYMLYHTTWLIAKLDPIKYIFENLLCLGELQDDRCYYQNLILFMYPERLSREVQWLISLQIELLKIMSL